MSVPPPPVMWTATQPPFTMAQWQELEHQALIFKYLKAGLSVPPDLLVPIRKSLQLMSHHHHHHHPSLGYYGKKIDPEPGRCRRTDGKKWRCSRDAHPDSKYCDRHMIRRRYRSRKPVESQPQPSPSSSSSSPLDATTGSTTTASASATGTFHTLPLHTDGTREGFTFTLGNTTNTLPHLHMNTLPLSGEGSKKAYRFGLDSEADEQNALQKDLGSVRYQGYDFTSDSMWSHLSQVPSNTVSESRSASTMVGNCFQQRTMRDAELLNLDAARSKELVFSGQLSSAGGLKQEYQSPQSLFSDWHWKKDLGSSAIEYRPNKDFNCNPDVNVDSNGSL
ncbi:growth-regulating factor 5-like [Gastrolobium bilobum]|uniref:growth-regulating factor 5-like n=1 Tax=Gastrolobium bilobum TaxID=150636 RepID=UPI002AB1A869|nr:growth-regulating factor 5-like [Gastrolobium bilobum]